MAISDFEYQKAGEFGFKEMVMMQFNKVNTFCNVEFRGGFYTKGVNKAGEEKDYYVQDTREVFGNACFSLALILQPRFSDEMKTVFKAHLAAADKIKKDFIDASSTDEKVILGDSFYENEKDKILLEEYKNKRLDLNLRLYAQLSKEMSNKNYFQVLDATF